MSKRLVGILLISACGGAPEPVTPAPAPGGGIEATIVPSSAPAEPATRNDVGPGALPAPVAEALERAFPKGRRIRCEGVPVDASPGVVAAVWLGSTEEHLRAATVEAGWFAGVAPTSEGRGLVLRDGRALAELSWSDASTGAWAACKVEPVERYQILGLVQTPDEKVVPSAKVRGCEEGAVTTTDANGRFELQGVSGRDCPLIAIVDDASGLGRSEPTIVHSERRAEEAPLPDVLVEITLTPERVARADVADQTRRIHGLKQRALRNGLVAEAEGFDKRIEAADLSPGARKFADRWAADLRARVAADEAVVAALGRGDVDGLLTYWMHDL